MLHIFNISLIGRVDARRRARVYPRRRARSERAFNLGLASGHKTQNRTTWRTLAGTATSPTSFD